MSQWDYPARGALAIAKPAAARSEGRILLLWRGFAGSIALAAYSVAGFAAAFLALLPLAFRRPSGRRALAGAASAELGDDQQALPG